PPFLVVAPRAAPSNASRKRSVSLAHGPWLRAGRPSEARTYPRGTRSVGFQGGSGERPITDLAQRARSGRWRPGAEHARRLGASPRPSLAGLAVRRAPDRGRWRHAKLRAAAR